MVEAGESFSVLHSLLDRNDPFEWDEDNLPHTASHPFHGPDDAMDVFFGEPEFYEDASDGSASWLMVGEVPGGDILVVPLATSQYSGYAKVRPLGVFEAPQHIINRYYQDKEVQP